MEYVNKLLDRIITDAPSLLELNIGEQKYKFKKVNPSSTIGAILRYEDAINSFKKIWLEIRHAFIPDTNFNRLEIHAPGKSAQLTCFHFGQLGFVSGESIIDITQIIKFSGQNNPKINKQKKEAAVEILENEGLIKNDKKKAPRWYVGTYNNKTQEWLYGNSTSGFLSNFLKVALIMGHFRGDRDFELNLNKSLS